MDHSSHAAMDHGGMDHGGHGGMDHGPMCSMNMLFTWDTTNLCIVFRWWHITSTISLILSLLGVVALVAGYEALRDFIRRYELWVAKRADSVPPSYNATSEIDEERANAEATPRWLPGQEQVAITDRAHIIKSVLYGVQNFYAFMIMLIFMTYNGWVMLAVSVGAGLGYLFFGKRTTATKDTACH